MARPLTKKKKNGDLYIRDQDIEDEIDDVLALSLDEQRKRLWISAPNQIGYLRSETLVHLARNALRHNDQSFANTVVKVLFSRCEANLRSTVSNQLPNAKDIRQDVMSQFGSLIARAGTGKNPDQLDFYECRFNKALKSLRIDVVTRETELTNRIASLPNPQNSAEVEDGEDAFEQLVSIKISPAAMTKYSPSPEEQLIAREKIHAAINGLPSDERKALILVHIQGYTQVTAAEKHPLWSRLQDLMLN